MSREKGFRGRVFLEEYEWLTYSRRLPVRRIRRAHSGVCAVCGQAGEPSNPLEHSHKIGFKVGVLLLGLTPDFLDGPDNIVSAHKKVCNRSAELPIGDALHFLKALGVGPVPAFTEVGRDYQAQARVSE